MMADSQKDPSLSPGCPCHPTHHSPQCLSSQDIGQGIPKMIERSPFDPRVGEAVLAYLMSLSFQKNQCHPMEINGFDSILHTIPLRDRL
jgi:hypothetical protein